MAVTGRTADGALVFDDTIDSKGRRVIDATNRILDDGTHYFEITAAPPATGPPAHVVQYRDLRRR